MSARNSAAEPQALPASPASPPTTRDPEKHEKKPEDTPFKQQQLPAWQPVMSPMSVISCLSVVGVVFLILGSVIVVASDSVVSVEVRYDTLSCPWSQRNSSASNFSCLGHTDFPVTKTLKAPVFLYYKLDGFYQNHRRYAKSRNDIQLSGTDVGTGDILDCAPFGKITESIPNLGDNQTDLMIPFLPTDPAASSINDVIYSPCGLIAWSMFNDSFSLSSLETSGDETLICDGSQFDVLGNPFPSFGNKTNYCEKKGIAWPSDPGVRFAATTPKPSILTDSGWPGACSGNITSKWKDYFCRGWYVGEPGHKIPNATDEDLMVWMRLSSMSTFRKLYRKVTKDVVPGNYRLTIKQSFDVSGFKGKKYFVMSTTSWIGGDNYFLGGLYLTVGSLCIVLGAAFLAKHCTTKQKLVSM